jgi:hypothetical protein
MSFCESHCYLCDVVFAHICGFSLRISSTCSCLVCCGLVFPFSNRAIPVLWCVTHLWLLHPPFPFLVVLWPSIQRPVCAFPVCRSPFHVVFSSRPWSAIAWVFVTVVRLLPMGVGVVTFVLPGLPPFWSSRIPRACTLTHFPPPPPSLLGFPLLLQLCQTHVRSPSPRAVPVGLATSITWFACNRLAVWSSLPRRRRVRARVLGVWCWLFPSWSRFCVSPSCPARMYCKLVCWSCSD